MFKEKKTSWFLKANTLIIYGAIFAFLAAALSGTGYAYEWWSVSTAFTILRYSVYAALAICVLILVALWGVAFLKARDHGRLLRTSMSAIIFAASLGFSWNVYSQLQTARQVPPIHDVTTDLDNIPQFVALNPQNPNRPNWELQHRAGYPDIQPLTINLPVAEVIEKATRAAEAFGWTVAASVPEEGRLEVTETTRWFRFKDDLILRVRPDAAGGSIVDARSISRFAGSDIGVNAARIRKLFAVLQE